MVINIPLNGDQNLVEREEGVERVLIGPKKREEEMYNQRKGPGKEETMIKRKERRMNEGKNQRITKTDTIQSSIGRGFHERWPVR